MALLKRKQTPEIRKTIQYYKPYLRIDFGYCCAYCNNHEAVEGGSQNFEIDHYKPKKKFPNLAYSYLNLFYSCKECNRSKSDYYHNRIDFFIGKYILNPCDHDFEKHYDMGSPEWKGKTSVAMWNIQRLRLNSPKRIQTRNDEILASEMINDLSSQEEELKEILSKNKLSDCSRISAEKDIKRIQKEIAFCKRKTTEPLD